MIPQPKTKNRRQTDKTYWQTKPKNYNSECIKGNQQLNQEKFQQEK